MNRIRKIEDKRKFGRLEGYQLVKYRVLSREREYGKPVLANLKDIGGGGICLETREELPVSGILEILINFPEISIPVPALAKVVWSKMLKSTKVFRVGVEFLELDEKLRRSIIDTVEGINSAFLKQGSKKG